MKERCVLSGKKGQLLAYISRFAVDSQPVDNQSTKQRIAKYNKAWTRLWKQIDALRLFEKES